MWNDRYSMFTAGSLFHHKLVKEAVLYFDFGYIGAPFETRLL